MANVAVSNTFVAGTTIVASQVNTNFSDLVNYINNRNGGGTAWDALSVTGTSTLTGAVDIGSTLAVAGVSSFPSGTAALPSITFTGDTNTGIYHPNPDQLTCVANGATIFSAYASRIESHTEHRFQDGTAGAPGINFVSDTDTGIYRGGANRLDVALGGVDTVTFSSSSISSVVKYLAPDGSDSLPAISFASATAIGLYSDGGDLGLVVPTGKGFSFRVNGVQVISGTATNWLPVGAGVVSTGTAANYWNDVSYKTLTDRGCLPFCDDGVELADGRFVSDTEAIKLIEKHPTKKTIQGLPMLNYKTFPKKAYKKADDTDGTILPRDENDEPVGGSDGIEMTMMFGVMLGAIKELTQRLELIEGK